MTEPQPGSYTVVDNHGIYAATIRRFTRSKYSHAFINLGDGLILEADAAGSHITALAKYDGRPMLTSEPAPGYQVGDWAAQTRWLDIPYGFADIAWLGLDYGVGWRPQWVLSEVREDPNMICSQLVAAWGAWYGANWSCGQEYLQEVTPGMLATRIGAQ